MTDNPNNFLHHLRMMTLAGFFAAISACASLAPEPVRENFPDQPTVEQARSTIDKYIGQRVRWGGTIVRVENQAQESIIEIVNRTLDATARPLHQDQSGGRFLAVIPGFVDPAIYEPGRDLTVIGMLEKTVTAPLGNFPYQYPQLRVESHKLWEKYPPRYYRRDPYGYDPWYPWYSPWWYY